jgi:hypothetical protein
VKSAILGVASRIIAVLDATLLLTTIIDFNTKVIISPQFPFSLVSVSVDELGFLGLFDAKHDHKLVVLILAHTLAQVEYSSGGD